MKKNLLTLATLLCSLALAAQTKVVEFPATDALYRLPFEKGTKVVAHSLSAVEAGKGRALNTVDFCAWSLQTKSNSDIFAPRGGVVEEATEGTLLILHEDGLYTQLSRLESVCVAAGDRVEKGTLVGKASQFDEQSPREVVMATFYVSPNPNHGGEALNSNYETLVHYFNPIVATRSKCKTQFTDGGSYTVKTRTWCWPWE